jgi:DNA-binding response OmpR family regulator
MPALFLLIPDAALREAVVEQLAAAKIGEARLVDTLQAFLKQVEGGMSCILVVDEAAYDKKNAALLCGLESAPEKPVLLLLGSGDDAEGLNETFAKPLRLGHLLARLRYYMETAPLLRDRSVCFGSYRLEPQNRRVFGAKEAEPIRLTEKETALLVFLAQNKEPATRRDILAAVWGYDERIDTHTLETHIYQLRRKLADGEENWLVSESGTYRLARGQA